MRHLELEDTEKDWMKFLEDLLHKVFQNYKCRVVDAGQTGRVVIAG